MANDELKDVVVRATPNGPHIVEGRVELLDTVGDRLQHEQRKHRSLSLRSIEQQTVLRWNSQ